MVEFEVQRAGGSLGRAPAGLLMLQNSPPESPTSEGRNVSQAHAASRRSLQRPREAKGIHQRFALRTRGGRHAPSDVWLVFS